MWDDITIRPAGESELDAIASMWDEAAEWLDSKGIDQWQYPASREKITRDIARGTSYVVRAVGEYIGTITVDTTADPEFWLPGDAPDAALYGHRIIVRPVGRGQDIGVAMLDWASQKAEKAGKRWLRVDVWKTNAELGRYYESQGFERVRTVDLPHRRSGALYQRRAGVVTGRGPKYVGLELPVHDENGNPISEGYGGWTSAC
jgi:GNAT superfamily N-acetyltransferase